jgi:hypothetical protein
MIKISLKLFIFQIVYLNLQSFDGKFYLNYLSKAYELKHMQYKIIY